MQGSMVLDRLSTHLPDVHSPLNEEETGLRKGAVLLLLSLQAGDLVFPVITRPDTLTHHPGQVALPGGAVEPGDSSLWNTALRETEEELGINPTGIRGVGRLTAVPVTPSRFLLVPFVGFCERPPIVTPNPAEVAAVTWLQLADLRRPEYIREDVWELRLGPRVVTYFDLAGLIIWGATARVLGELAEVVGPVPWQVHRPGSVRPVPTGGV